MSEIFTPEVVWIVVQVCIGIIIMLNLVLNLNTVKNDTVNNRLSFWANGQFFFITFLWGVLGGHFFLGSVKPLFCCNWWLPVVILVILTGILVLLRHKINIKPYHQIILVLLGLVYGHFVWSQRHEPLLFNDGQCTNTNLFCKDD